MGNSKVYEKISIWLIVAFAIIQLIACLLTKELPYGEWDDYLYTTASLLNDQNMTISSDDIHYAHDLFPEAVKWGDFTGSTFHTSSGDILPWYFGTYSAACIPMVFVLKLLRLPAIHAFALTNVLFYLLALYCVYKKLNLSAKTKLGLLLLLMLNPAVFYIIWISAEVFIFSMIILAMIQWTNQKYWQSAVLISIASSLNPTILALAPILTIDYAYWLYQNGEDKTARGFIHQIKKNYKSILIYCICYVIALIPFAYNLIYTGHINLTAGAGGFFDDHLVLPRFWAYLTDLNFGFLPYYGLTFLLSIVLSVVAAIKQLYRGVLMMVGFLFTVFLYSFMEHINCGMSGIARYSCWGAPILLFSLAVTYAQLFKNAFWRRAFEVIICISLMWSGFVVYSYGLMGATRTTSISMTPFARKVLDYFPSLYNPLPSTFNSRITGVDGGYQYDTPLFYADDDDHVRKILASKTTAEDVLDNVTGNQEDMDDLRRKLSMLSDTDSYISIDRRHEIDLFKSYQQGDIIWFTSDKRNANRYVLEGLSGKKDQDAWTVGQYMRMRLKVKDAPQYANYQMQFTIEKVFGMKQRVVVEWNGNTIWTKDITEMGDYSFVIPDVNYGVIDLVFRFPDAISPFSVDGSPDDRELALAFVSATISEVK